MDTSSVWLRLLSTISSLADLAAINTTILKNGAMVFVTESRVYYFLLRSASDAPNGTTIVEPASGPGRWFAIPITATPTWETQAEWYIDPVNGNDANNGDTSSSALATQAELTRRIGSAYLQQNTTIHLLNNIPNTDSFVFRGVIGGAASLKLVGENPTQLFTGVLSAVQDLNLGSDRPTITINGVDWSTAGPGGTSLVGKRCRVTATAGGTQIGTLFWIEEATGDTAAISTPAFVVPPSFLPSQETVSVGDTIVVEEMTQSGPIALDWGLDGVLRTVVSQVIVQDIKGISGNTELFLGVGSRQTAMTYGCDLVYASVAASNLNAVASKVGDGGSHFLYTLGFVELRACSVQCNLFLVNGGSEVVFASNSSVQGKLIAGLSAAADGPNVVVVDGLSLWGWTNGAAVSVQFSGFARFNALVWGVSASANTYGVDVSSGAYVQYDAASKPTVEGSLSGGGTDAIVGGNSVDYASLPVLDATNNAALVEASV